MAKRTGSQIRQQQQQQNGWGKSGKGISSQTGQNGGMYRKHHQKCVQGGRGRKGEN